MNDIESLFSILSRDHLISLVCILLVLILALSIVIAALCIRNWYAAERLIHNHMPELTRHVLSTVESLLATIIAGNKDIILIPQVRVSMKYKGRLFRVIVFYNPNQDCQHVNLIVAYHTNRLQPDYMVELDKKSKYYDAKDLNEAVHDILIHIQSVGWKSEEKLLALSQSA